MTFENIPHEMRSYRQWVCWKQEQTNSPKSTKVPYSPRTGIRASVTDPAAWASFDEAIAAASYYDGIGFVLTDNDPYSFIDLDVKEDEQPTSEQQAIYNKFDSYAEYSPSRRGVHIVVRGRVPTGKRQGNVEIYSRDRYMTMTGNALRSGPIADYDAMLNALWVNMGGNTEQAAQEAPDGQQTVPDKEVIERACKATNGAKFTALWQGDASVLDSADTSGSAVDMALLDIIAFYTDSKAQAERIWLESPQGKRKKTQEREDYRKRSVEMAFDRKFKKVSINLPNPFEKPTEENTQTFNLGELLLQAATEPETEFTTEYLTPIEDVTLLSANGGVGRSFLALTWLLCIAAGRLFMGLKVMQSSVLFVTAEDRRKECAKRLAAICADMQLLLSNQFTKQIHFNFNLWEILSKPLWIEDKSNAAGVPTLTMIELERRIIATRAKQVVIDNASSVFCANHNDNVQVTAFISYLRGVAERTKCNILILAHVSADNATKGTPKTYFGSTAWHNSVRSRIFMELKPAQDGIAEYINVIHEKSNYGKLAETFKLQRNTDTGVLRLLSNREIAQAIDENISNVADQVYSDITAMFEKGEYIVVSIQGSTNFYSCLSGYFPNKYREGDRKTKQEVKLAIQRLADAKMIVKQNRITEKRNSTTVWVPALPITETKP